MKKLITYTSICLIAGILFSSCGTHLTITKRHYRNGYSISYSGKNLAETNSQESVKESEMINETNSKLDEKTNTDVESIECKSNHGSVDKVVENEKTLNSDPLNTISESSSKNNTDIETTNGSVKKDTNSKHLLKGKSIFKNFKDHSDGLSLFWIVILVILILWAIGFIGGSVGSLINLLLLVALILLILWLLRVI